VAKEQGVTGKQVTGLIGTALNNVEVRRSIRSCMVTLRNRGQPWVDIGKDAATAIEAAQVTKEAKVAQQPAQPAQQGVDVPRSRGRTPIGGMAQAGGAGGGVTPTTPGATPAGGGATPAGGGATPTSSTPDTSPGILRVYSTSHPVGACGHVE